MTPRTDGPEPVRPPRAISNAAVGRFASTAIGSVALLVVLAGGSAAPAGDWSMFRGDPRLTGRASGRLPDRPEVLWTFEAEEGFESSAAIRDGVVYAASLDGRLRALRLDTGDVLWTHETGTEIKSSPAVHEGVVYFGDEDGVFHAVSATDGKTRWTFGADGAINASANLHGDVVLFGSQDNFLYCLARKDGALRWKLETGSYVYATPAVLEKEGGAAILAGCDGYLRVVRIADGTELESVDIGGYVGASPAVDGGHAYLGTFENEFLAIDLEKGEVLWRYQNPERQFPFYSSAALGDDIVVFGGRDKMVHALDPKTGETLWTYPTKARVDSSPVILGGRAFVGTMAGEILALDLASGRPVWTFDTGSPVLASPAIAGDRLVIGTVDGVLYCFGGRAPAAASR